jgi:adenylate cyclase
MYMRRKSAFRFYYLLPLIVALIVGASMLIPWMQTGDRRVYDIFLHIKPAVEEDESLLLLDIDDLAIAQVGTWPWSRSVVADGLILLREFEADTVVFDIEYVDPSPQGVDSRYLNQELPRLFNAGFNDLNENINAFFDALLQGYIPLEEAEEYVGELTGISDEIRGNLLAAVRRVARDNDEYMGDAFRLFGNAWATVNMLPDDIELVQVSEQLRSYVLSDIPLRAFSSSDALTPSLQAPAVQPAIYPIITGAAGAGFPNVVVDEDGVRRRIDLVSRYKDAYYGQLVFAPLLKRLGNPQVELRKGRILLDYGDRQTEIPLDSGGRMVINWPPKSYEESFRHLSYNELVVHDRLEEQVARNLEIMNQAGYLDFHRSEAPVMDLYLYASQLREDLLKTAKENTPDEAAVAEYREIRNIFFETLASLVSGETESELTAEIDRILASPELESAQRSEYEAIREEVVSSFAALKGDAQRLVGIRELLRKELSGSFVIIGHTGISTTDIGVNPFEKEYMNVGTHAAVANTILKEEFLDELHPLYGLAAALVLTFLLAFTIQSLAPFSSIVVGLLFIAGTVAAGLGLFLIQGWYLPMLPPLLMLSLTFLAVSAIKFMRTEGEKSFLRSAFSHYLSADVIKQLIDDPERLNLGGEKKELTAIFTDIMGFSTISEQLDPTELVKLLNHYLTAMSDTILGMRGTIDKYEGDAIIAFFGAPLELEDHAYRACLSAVQMKRIEHDLNRRFVEQGLSPSPLQTRVGINTGEMVVGNMGTLQKMDYTIMGNAVNLAARLEGVNKQYGTWILTSEHTSKAAGDQFTVRQLDRVRVVGIKQPVRLFELIEEKDRTSPATREALDTFHAALENFEAREWEQSEKLFRAVQRFMPDDGPSGFFLERIKKFKKTPPAENWDGVFNLTLK